MRRLILSLLIVGALFAGAVAPALAGPTENTGHVTIPDQAKVVGMPASADGRATANAAIPGP
ncbi:MAG: hypothetical protein HYY03_02825 [Chloroflexi bacterium]|nr:hypothetical protein [Chloroflexota bacterium]